MGSLLALGLVGCASHPQPPQYAWYVGNVARAPLNRIEPGTVVRFQPKAQPAHIISQGSNTVEIEGVQVTHRATLGTAQSTKTFRESTVAQAYGDVGFVTTLGEGVRYDAIDTLDFQYRRTTGEVVGDNVRRGVVMPLVIPCILLGGCPIN